MVDGKKILVIDDDPNVLKLLEYCLCQASAEVALAADGKTGLRLFHSVQPDAVILDIMMPGMDGLETCRHIRQLSDVPIIMLTALGKDEDIISGLECGADDYVAKPFNHQVLLARLRGALRRASLPPATHEPVSYNDGYLTIDLAANRVLVLGQPVHLTATELRLLACLVHNAGRTLTYRQILEKVWGWEYVDDVDYLRTYIWHLRTKLEEDSKKPRYLLTEHGLGYSFRKR